MTEDADYHRLPGLYRVWDLPTLLADAGDYRIHFAEPTQDGTPLYAVYARPVATCVLPLRPQ
jgi:hypothetical protein